MEYALLVALIAVVCITAVTFLGTSSSGKFNSVGSTIDGGSSESANPYEGWTCSAAGNIHVFIDPSDTNNVSQGFSGPCP